MSRSIVLRWGVVAAAVGLCGCAQRSDPPGRPVGADAPVLAGGVAQVWVNEVMAQNRSSWQDELGAYPDWVELWNPNDTAVDLSGWWMSDDADDPFDWQIPAGVTIGPDEHLVISCDGDEDQGELHAGFHLSGAGGEDVALFGPNVLDNPVVDLVEDMAPQGADVSMARVPDGGPTWSPDDSPTPAASNED